MEKRSWDTKEKTQPKHEGSKSRRENHKYRPRDRSPTRPSRRRYDNLSESFTPLNVKVDDILREVYHLKLIPEPPRPKRVNTVLGNDIGAWCAYHRIKFHHNEDYQHLKREIETLI